MERPRDGPPPREPMAEPAALPWGMDKSDVQKSSLNALTDEKLARFVIGQQKKTKFEKEREEREEKKRKADEEASAIYAKFVASFEDNNDDTLGKAFVRSGGDAGDVYRLQGHAPLRKTKLSEMDRLVEEMKHKESDGQPPKKKQREMDLLVEEIKNREPLLVVENEPVAKGSFDTGDPHTTNLYVGNLATPVTEESLHKVFAKYGRIHSVKIMWPRTEEERARRRMSGFVSFLTRREADDARVHLHDSELDGQRIVVGWGKAVKIEVTAALPFHSTVGAATVPSVSTEGKTTIVVEVPGDPHTRQRVDRLAAYVAKDGLEFENAVRAREASNPQYQFLFDGSAVGVYYRWRVFALAMGDSEHQWREAPFQMTANGPVWIPPRVPALPPPPVLDDGRSRSRARNGGRNSPSRSRRSHSRSRSQSSRRRRSRSRSRSARRRRRSRSRSSDSGSSRSRSSRSPSRGRYHSSRGRRRSSRSRSPSYSRSATSRRDHSRSDSRSPRRRHVNSSHRVNPVLTKDETMLTGQQLARARDVERGRERNRLPREAYEQLMELLARLSLERESIKHAMGCALDNSESAVEIVHIISAQFDRDDISAVHLVALLFMVSDILHNSSAAVKNASLFRSTFHDCLPAICDRLRRVHKSIGGRMSALAMRDKVLSVLTAWGSWSLFPPHYLVGLNATFMRKLEEDEYLALHEGQIEPPATKDEEDKIRKTCVQAGVLATGRGIHLVARLQWLKEFTAPATAKPVQLPVLPPSTQASGVTDTKKTEKEPGPGESRVEKDEPPSRDSEDDNVDGEPLDTQQIDNVDGEPLDEDVDGEPLDEDVDGEPLDEDVDDEPV